jgi:hypothetical protein
MDRACRALVSERSQRDAESPLSAFRRKDIDMRATRTVRTAAALIVVAAASALTTAALADPTPAALSDSIHAHAAPVYQPAAEMHFVPITPCRIVDTRPGTKLGAGAQRAFYVTGATGFAGQGGNSSGCGIPAGATAIAVNLLTFGATHAGYTRAWANGTSEPVSAVLAYPRSVTASGGATVAIAPTEPSLRVHNYQGATDLTIGVTGYYVKPLAGFISPSGSPYSGSSRIVSAAHPATGVYEVQFDRNIRYCAAQATVYVSNYFASVSTWFDSSRPDTARVNLWTNAGAAADQYFYISVEC